MTQEEFTECEQLKPCPFCGKVPNLEDKDTLYPNGFGWIFDETLNCKTYHKLPEVPKDQWCFVLNCNCGIELHADSRHECINNWNKRFTSI